MIPQLPKISLSKLLMDPEAALGAERELIGKIKGREFDREEARQLTRLIASRTRTLAVYGYILRVMWGGIRLLTHIRLTALKAVMTISRVIKSFWRSPRDLSLPPAGCEFVLRWATNPKHRDSIVLEFDEIYQKNVERFGVGRARWFYRADTLHSVGPLLWQGIKRAVWLGFLFSKNLY